MSTPDFAKFMDQDPVGDQKVLLDRFVEEYIKDFDAVAAAGRLGFNFAFATEYAKTFMTTPYVRRQIIEKKLIPAEEDEEQKIRRHKTMIESTLIEVMNTGDAKSRAIAASKLATIHGLDKTPSKAGDALQQLADSFANIATKLPD